MTVVIDIGCAKWGGDESIPYLVETFEPSILYGFDPGAEPPFAWKVGETVVQVNQWAAWTYDGTIGFKVARLGGHVEDDAPSYPCFDLARFINELTDDQPIVLKMDAEGAEYVLLPHLCQHDADLRLELALVEWHCEHCGLGGNGRHRENCRADRDWWQQRRTSVEDEMRCTMEEWNL